VEEVKIFTVDLVGVINQELHKIESEINAYLAHKELVTMEQSIWQDRLTNHTKLIVTVVAKKK
jgi:hypothetical protein